VGPFVRFAAPVLDACLDAGTCYVDIANELTAIRGVLERDGQAKARGITAVTGAGFGPGGTESLVLDLVRELGETPDLVRVATVPAPSHVTPGVQETIAALLPEGATTYAGGELTRAPFGTGATVLEFGGARRTMLPGPAGDLEAARLASGAANVSAYFGDPAERVEGEKFSYAYAEVVAGSGRRLAAQAQVGDGVEAGAAFAAEVARRVLAATRAAPGDDRRRRDAHRAGRHPRRPPCPVARRRDHRAGQSRSSARLTDGTSRRVLAVLALLRIGTADRDAI
jgi:hypothetical protein